MSAGEVQPGRWSPVWWFCFIAAVCAVQLGVLFWIGDAPPAAPPPLPPAPVLGFSGHGGGPLLALEDPTLFALPHRQGFSGKGWLIPPPEVAPPYSWSEPLDWLQVPVADLGEPFRQFMRTNIFESSALALEPHAPLTMPAPSELEMLPQHSSLRVEGPLAQRRLLSTPDLPSWTHAELLTNSVIETVVDADGRPVSVTLLRPSSGSSNADQFALDQARALRFAPLPTRAAASAVAGLTWGELVFAWHTLAPAPEPKKTK